MYSEGIGTLQLLKMHTCGLISQPLMEVEAVEQRKIMTERMSALGVEEAQSMARRCIQSNYSDCGLKFQPQKKEILSQKQNEPKLFQPQKFETEAYFQSLSELKRKQIQYALKELGYYSSIVDGIWGKGTNGAISSYLSSTKKITSLAELYPNLVNSVAVPTKFKPIKKPAVGTGKTRTFDISKLSGDARVCALQGYAPESNSFFQCLNYERQKRQYQADALMRLGLGLMGSSGSRPVAPPPPSVSE